jgi:hypothetical protein
MELGVAVCSISQLFFVTETHCSFYEVGIEFLNAI